MVYIKKDFLIHTDYVSIWYIYICISYCNKIVKHSHDMNKQRWNKNGRIQNTRRKNADSQRWPGFCQETFFSYSYLKKKRRLKVLLKKVSKCVYIYRYKWLFTLFLWQWQHYVWTNFIYAFAGPYSFHHCQMINDQKCLTIDVRAIHQGLTKMRCISQAV